MASPTTAGFQAVAPLAPTAAIRDTSARAARRRRISPQAGRALEILGHAIEYLTDEYVHAGGSLDANDAEVRAIQLLMAINRGIYLECPEVPTFGERCREWLRFRSA